VPPTFSLAANALGNGLDAGETTVFKSPSLKNVAVSGPYMHDGRFATLAQVVDFYATGVQAGPALDNRLRVQNGQPARLNNLSSADRAALVAFMATLTDTPLTGDARFASPFR
jgi:cytochrome c peroxidase